MRTFYVLIKCELGKAYEVASALVDRIDDHPPKVHSISGKYDLIAQFHLPSDVDIGRFMNAQVHSVPGIAETETLICFNAFTPDAGLGSE